jgi:hypothetical protein
MNFFLLYLLGAILTFPAVDHELYISIVEINHEAQAEMAAVTIRVFTDDFEDALKNRFDKPVKFTGRTTCVDFAKEITTYVDEHFSLRISDREVELLYQGCHGEYETTWLNFEIQCAPNWERVHVKADQLMELFPTQANVIKIFHQDQKQFLLLTKKKTEGGGEF